MTLRKITFDNSVKYIVQNDQTQSGSRNIKQNTIKNNSLPKKQKNCRKIFKISLKIS